MAERGAGSGGMGGDDADVGDVVSFFESGKRVDVEDDSGDGGAGLGDDFAEEVSDIAELHTGFDVGAAFHERIEDAKLLAEDVNDFIEPDRILDGMRVAGKHFEGAHGAEGAVDEERKVVGFDGTGVAGFDDDGGFAADGGGVIEVASGGRISGALAPDDDVIEAESKDHLLGDAILLFPSRWPPVGVRTKALVEVAAVVVDEIVAAVDDLFGDEEGGALGLRAVGFARVEAVHAFVVDGIDVRDLLFEGRDVDQWDEDDDAGDLRGVESVDEFFDGDDGGVFGAMRSGDEGENFSGLCAVDNDDGDAGGGVNAGRDFKVAGGFLAGRSGSGADGETGLRGSWTAAKQREKRDCENRTLKMHHSPFSNFGSADAGRAGVDSPLT